MGKEKYLRHIEALFSRSPVVSYASIERVIKHKKNVKGYVKRFINELLKKGKIKKLTKGYYTMLDNSSLAVFCFQPAYLGLQDALSFHDLWEQETIPVIITTKKVRQGVRKVLGNNVLIRRLDRKYLFGINYHQEGKIAFPYSDIEKTFIDMAYFNEKLSKETIGEFKKRLNKQKLKVYLRKYPKKIRSKIESKTR
jgi:predicted transcriptional regulator of viral defense system